MELKSFYRVIVPFFCLFGFLDAQTTETVFRSAINLRGNEIRNVSLQKKTAQNWGAPFQGQIGYNTTSQRVQYGNSSLIWKYLLDDSDFTVLNASIAAAASSANSSLKTGGNGLTVTGTSIELGGNLEKNTVLNNSDKRFIFDGQTTSLTIDDGTSVVNLVGDNQVSMSSGTSYLRTTETGVNSGAATFTFNNPNGGLSMGATGRYDFNTDSEMYLHGDERLELSSANLLKIHSGGDLDVGATSFNYQGTAFFANMSGDFQVITTGNVGFSADGNFDVITGQLAINIPSADAVGKVLTLTDATSKAVAFQQLPPIGSGEIGLAEVQVNDGISFSSPSSNFLIQGQSDTGTVNVHGDAEVSISSGNLIAQSDAINLMLNDGDTAVEMNAGNLGLAAGNGIYVIAPKFIFSSPLPIYADNAAAIAGGLLLGQAYRTSSGVLMVRF